MVDASKTDRVLGTEVSLKASPWNAKPETRAASPATRARATIESTPRLRDWNRQEAALGANALVLWFCLSSWLFPILRKA